MSGCTALRSFVSRTPTSSGLGRLRLLVPILVLAILAACDPAPEGPVFPGEEWERWSSPEAGGMSSEGLQAVQSRLEEMSTSAMMIATGGRVAFEYGDLTEVSYLASVRKSILAILYGIHHDRGEVDLDLTLADLDMDDHRGLTDQERQATNRHLILSRSGVYHPASNPGDNLAAAPEPGSMAPGEYYLYSNWDFNAAGTAFEVQTGMDLFDSLEQNLAIPLGFRDFDRDRHEKGGDPERSMHPSYHMHLSTRDMARVGYLVLRNGEWDGRQIVSSEWVAEMTAPLTRVHEMNPEGRRDGPHGYGYMWWVWDGEHATGPYEGAYTGVGAVGQYITVLPALDMVVAHKTVPGDGRSVGHRDFWEVMDQVVAAYCGQDC
jgi:CubicO group peptidase (beta-lactamase class C family)